ncbi:protein of unknown function [Kyrpidia spormannii]|uniref:Uncharacterized protein n=1 Tax=Kyrpidia spormannii TaxID=2055160 RepID=A0ACA8Z5L1_9BACL|nr:protein of unknown function [Kyrpidia spormannii]
MSPPRHPRGGEGRIAPAFAGKKSRIPERAGAWGRMKPVALPKSGIARVESGPSKDL